MIEFIAREPQQTIKTRLRALRLNFSCLYWTYYLKWVSDLFREDKHGFIEQSQPEILKRLHISAAHWFIITTEFRTQFHGAVGREAALTDFCEHQHFKRRQNLSHCNKLFA